MFGNKNNSISRRLTLMNVLVSGTALLLACAAFITFDVISFRETRMRNLSTQAQVIASNTVTALLFDDPQAANSTLSALRAAPAILSAEIFLPDGRLFASFTRETGYRSQHPIPTDEIETSHIENGLMTLQREIDIDGKRVATIYIRSDMKDLHRRFIRNLLIAGIVLAASLFAALSISSFFRRAVAQPIIDLSNVARSVSKDKTYSIRAASTTGPTEVSILIDAFNEMLGQIQHNESDLRIVHNQLEQRVAERTAELAAANKELEAFSYSVSHDLRAPLRSIDGFSQALLEDYAGQLDSTATGYLKRVRKATLHMSQLIDDLLNLARLTRTEMRREIVNLTALAEVVAEGLQKEEPDRQVEFVIAPGLNAKADEPLLRIVMVNLLGNAWKYSSAHSRSRIEFGTTPHKGRQAYFVRDDGAGFDQRYADRLFGAFQRLHATNEFPGTGIGLATVHRIISRHGGQVWAEGAIEKGATFYFTL